MWVSVFLSARQALLHSSSRLTTQTHIADISENVTGEFIHTDLWQSVSYMLLVWIIHEPVLHAFGHYLTLQTCQLFTMLITVMFSTLPASLLIWQLKACFTTLPPLQPNYSQGCVCVCAWREKGKSLKSMSAESMLWGLTWSENSISLSTGMLFVTALHVHTECAGLANNK